MCTTYIRMYTLSRMVSDVDVEMELILHTRAQPRTRTHPRKQIKRSTFASTHASRSADLMHILQKGWMVDGGIRLGYVMYDTPISARERKRALYYAFVISHATRKHAWLSFSVPFAEPNMEQKTAENVGENSVCVLLLALARAFVCKQCAKHFHHHYRSFCVGPHVCQRSSIRPYACRGTGRSCTTT